MMRVQRHTPESEDHGIDLAPMLDFTINLLIFFIIITAFVNDPGVTVVKPDAVTAVEHASGNLLIAIRENGEIWMDGQQVELRKLEAWIERLHIQRPDDTVVIIADKESNAGTVAKVMDKVRAGGITDIAIAAEPIGKS
ncbi:MAG: biopolymer transporter ExbD [Nitrococcus sp.]|nr:biopolymer transporter ExbD [Nitrococcus sp.]